MGGVGWWTSPLVIYQLLASAVYVVLRGVQRECLRGAILSTPAFFLGAAPFFYFYDDRSLRGHSEHGRRFRPTRHVPWACTVGFFRARAAIPRLGPLSRRRSRSAPGLAARRLRMGRWLFFLWHLRESIQRAGSASGMPRSFPSSSSSSCLSSPQAFASSGEVPRMYALPLSALLPGSPRILALVPRAAPGSSRLWLAAPRRSFSSTDGTTSSWVVPRGASCRRRASCNTVSTLIQALEAKGIQHLYTSDSGLARIGTAQLLRPGANHGVARLSAERYRPISCPGTRPPSRLSLSWEARDRLMPAFKALGAAAEPRADRGL